MMAAENRTTAVTELKGANYPTWKVQVKMSLVKDGLWGVVSGIENAPSQSDGENIIYSVPEGIEL